MVLFLCLVAVSFGIVTSAPAYCRVLPGIILGAFYLYCHVWRRVVVRKDALSALAQGVLFSAYLLYMLLRREAAFFYHALSDLSLAFSGLAGALVGRPIIMSVTYSGIDVVCLFLIAFSVAGLTRRERSALKWLAGLGGILVVWCAYMALWTVLAENSIALGLNRLEPVTGPLDYRLLLFAALLAAYIPAYRGLDARNTWPLVSDRRVRAAAAVWAALCLIACLSSFAPPKAPGWIAGKRVVFWDSGIDFTVPADGRYGLDQVGMFGFLPNYLEAKGYSCDVTDEIGAGVLETADVLVIINPMRTPGREGLDAIWSFVERGGGLLAVGDHTGDRQIRLPLNELLAPAGITFNFDSAMPFQSLWPDAFVTRRSPVFANVSDRQIQAVVGASLEISYKARPLLIGKTGYSDGGDLSNAADGFLGDMRFSRGERVGDLILAAESGHGSGRILAFGDTSFLQNTTLAYSYPLIDNLFAYLASGDTAGGGNADSGRAAAAGQAYAASYIIDAGHMPSFKTDKSGDAADGFIASALRAGMIPYVTRSASLSAAIEAARGLKLVALVEPAAALGAEDLLALREFAENGGAVMLFGTYRSPEATRSLFASFGFSFENLPIGRISPTQDPEMAFWNACPLLYDGRPAAEAPGAESLVEIWGYAVAARRDIGQGAVYAFGDGDFIKNKNLENVETYRKGNINFVGALLRDIAGGAARREGGADSHDGGQ
ncbi:MAG: hypothetical protein LBD68_09600 [Zoogloeaceae bacterium]|nr:hypothetical protein [Zoogloeaceae bacterium]